MDGDRTRNRWLVLALVFLVGYLPALWARDLWSNDEVRYVEVSRQLESYGHVLVPHLNASPYAEKPPMFFWLTVGLHGLVGDWSMAGRLLSMLATLLTTLLVILLGRLLFQDRAQALVSGLVYATLATVMDRGQEALLDPVLTLWTTATLLLLTLASRRHTADAGYWSAVVGATLGAGAGCLTKGPVAVLVTTAAGAALAWMQRGRRLRTVVATLVTLLGGGGLALLWLYLASRETGPWLLDYMLFDQAANRMSGPAEHAEAWHFYLPQLLGMLLPWTLLLPGALLAACQPRAPRAPRMLLLWTGGLLAIFSAFSAKRPGYVFPILVGLALILGHGIVTAQSDGRGVRRWLWRLPMVFLLPGLGAMLGLGLLAMPLCCGILGFDLLPQADRITVTMWSVLALVGIALVPLSIHLCRFAARNDLAAAACCLAIACALAGLAWNGIYARARDPESSYRPFAHAIATAMPADARLLLLQHHQHGKINLYTGVRYYETVLPEKLRERTDRADRLWLMARERHWQHVPADVQARFEIALERRIGHKHRRYMLLRERQP